MRSVVSEAKATIRFKTEDYSFEEYTLGAIVDEKESGAEVLTELKKQINEAFTGEVSEDVGKTKETAGKKAGKKEEKKDAKSKSTKNSSTDDENADDESTEEEDSGNADESNADDEATDGEDRNSDDDSSDDSESSESEDGESEPEEEDSKPAKGGKSSDKKAGGKKFTKKPQNYDRTVEQHKEIFSGLLRSVSPDWKKTDSGKDKAKKASQSLNGKPFLDDKGEVIEAFKSEVKKLMAVKKK